MRGDGLLLLVSLVSGCTQAVPTSSPFRAGSDAAAEEVVRGLLEDVLARNAAGVARGLCRAGSNWTAAGLEDGLEGWRVLAVEPSWAGAEPWFRVEAILRRHGVDEQRAFAVRAREGCVERVLGAPMAADGRPEPRLEQPADASDEISL